MGSRNSKPKPEQLNLPILGIAGPMVRRENPDTSYEAAESITQKRLTDVQTDVLEWFRLVRRATDEELEVHFRDKYPAQTTVSKRRTDLVRLGYLRDSGERRFNSNMRRMIVWELIVRKENEIANMPATGECPRGSRPA